MFLSVRNCFMLILNGVVCFQHLVAYLKPDSSASGK